MSNNLLTLDGVHTRIGHYHILHGVDLAVPRGELTMLLGRNGAGKTTTLRTIMGMWQASQGAIRFEDHAITRWQTPTIARLGIAYVPESMGIFAGLSVQENLTLAARNGPLDEARVEWIFHFFPALKKFCEAKSALAAANRGNWCAARFRKWADEYFYIPHRKVHRGVGGIFYDHLERDWAADFAFTQDVGRAFLDVYPRIVRRRMGLPFGEAERQQQLEWRGRYAEFNLIYDRGTLFGLKTGGNIDAILMSLPPMAAWS